MPPGRYQKDVLPPAKASDVTLMNLDHVVQYPGCLAVKASEVNPSMTQVLDLPFSNPVKKLICRISWQFHKHFLFSHPRPKDLKLFGSAPPTFPIFLQLYGPGRKDSPSQEVGPGGGQEVREYFRVDNFYPFSDLA